MEFGTAIPLQLRRQFYEGSKLAPERDTRNVATAWKSSRSHGIQQHATVQQLQKVSREVAKMRRRIVGGFVSKTTPIVFPFCIYNIQNVSASDAQKAAFKTANVNLDELTFQIRSGIVGCRPYINEPDSGALGPINSVIGNYELDLYVSCTDSVSLQQNQQYAITDFYYPQVSNAGTTIVLDDTNATLISGIPAGSPSGTAAVAYNQIALNQNPTHGEGIANPNLHGAAFWLEVVDDPLNGIYANLWGRMCSFEQTSTRTTTPIPTGTNIIPIGYVKVQVSDGVPNPPTVDGIVSGYIVVPIATGNVVNRFPPGCATMRGRWNEIFAALPSGITDIYFYPGDLVVDDSSPVVDPTSGFTYFKVWQFVKTPWFHYNVSQTPSIGDWIEVGIST